MTYYMPPAPKLSRVVPVPPHGICLLLHMHACIIGCMSAPHDHELLDKRL